MEVRDNGKWFDELFFDKLTNTEKLWRDIFRIADQYRLQLRFQRYPLTSKRKQYNITIYKIKDDIEELIIAEEGMELEPLLRAVRREINLYRNDHKDYIVQKPGGGELL